MSNALKSLIEEILSTEEVIEFQKLERLVLEKEEIKTTLERLHYVEKQVVNAKELGLENTYLAYKKEYDEILKSFDNDVLISSYLNAKVEVTEIIKLVTNIIENEINSVINN